LILGTTTARPAGPGRTVPGPYDEGMLDVGDILGAYARLIVEDAGHLGNETTKQYIYGAIDRFAGR
jgi:hypothetical protein